MKIRSTEGHSTWILDQCDLSKVLTCIGPTHPKWCDTVVHGTSAEYIRPIFTEGLKPGGKERSKGLRRGHVMCAPEAKDGKLVEGEVCGVRSTSTHLVYIDATKAREEYGISWYLTAGDKPAIVTDQDIPPTCIISICDRWTGEEEEFQGAIEPSVPKPSMKPITAEGSASSSARIACR